MKTDVHNKTFMEMFMVVLFIIQTTTVLSWGTDRSGVVRSYNGILGTRQEGRATGKNRSESQIHHRLTEARTQLLHDSNAVTSQKIPIMGSGDLPLQLGVGSQGWLHRDTKECFWVMELFYVLIMAAVS